MARFSVLVVDDEVEFTTVYKLILEGQGCSVSTANSGLECLKIMETKKVDLVITDLKMAGIDGLALLLQIKKRYPLCEVIIVTGYSTIESAVMAIKDGAFGYFVKGQDPALLVSEVKKLIRIRRLQEENEKISSGFQKSEYLLQTKNSKFQNILDIAAKAASSNSNILILGESGTGKEVIAKLIHRQSRRSSGPFIPVNCQMFSEGVLESELFGHEKGSFTGAIERRIGRFEEAHGGTLFLDEIGEIPPSTQTKLLRVLENKSFERIGSNRAIKVDIRLVSATNRNLEDAINSGFFREDLLYRINTITLKIPPLRDRKEDLPDLIHFFLTKFQAEMKKEILEPEEDLNSLLLSYNYPGNVRELRNIAERLVVLSDGKKIEISSLPDAVKSAMKHMYPANLGRQHSEKCANPTEIAETPALQPDSPPSHKTLHDVRAEAEAAHIRIVLRQCQGNMGKTAEILGISRRQLFNKLTEYGIKDDPRT